MTYWELSRNGLIAVDCALVVHPDRLSRGYSQWDWLGVTVIFDDLSPKRT